MPKIIVIRGNSGSGKTSTAEILQKTIVPHPVLIEQDNFRRRIIKEKDIPGRVISVELMLETVKFALKHDRHVIIEGIFKATSYGGLIDEIVKFHPQDNYFFYVDVSFEETLRRHAGKPNAGEFGEAEMHEWFNPHDLLPNVNETVLGEAMSQDEMVEKILEVSGLGEK